MTYILPQLLWGLLASDRPARVKHPYQPQVNRLDMGRCSSAALHQMRKREIDSIYQHVAILQASVQAIEKGRWRRHTARNPSTNFDAIVRLARALFPKCAHLVAFRQAPQGRPEGDGCHGFLFGPWD